MRATHVLGSIKTYATRLMKGDSPAQCRVLVVDDEETVLRFVERVLRDAGYKTSVATNGPEAIEAWRRARSTCSSPTS